MKRKIITDIRELKKENEEAISKEEIVSIIRDLEDSLDTSKGIGLSAIQIGIAKKVAIIRFGNTKLDLINPKIISKENRVRFPSEGCLSLPGLRIDTSRYAHIVIENNNGERYSLDGIEAIAVQHEIDHMNGKTILDRKWRRQ